MGLDYAAAKLSAAVSGMATSSRSIQERLMGAYMTFHPIKSDVEFKDHPDLKAQYDQIMERLTADKSDAHKGYVPTTTERMPDEEAEEVARMIVDLEYAVAQAYRP